ncbi:MAG TPA: SAM-dependent DNA methyltransferase, partial [Planctomycetota bacterium]|nr:SAM-dependent DNA methyltransferase [Planctomycetota bacterium]
MAKREANTDLWVYDMLKDVGLDKKFSAKGSTIKEINEALSTASKRGTGKVGFPEYVGVVKDFLIVIENKADISKHIDRDENGLIKSDVKSVTDYAVNGALFYGIHLSENTTYKKIIAL